MTKKTPALTSYTWALNDPGMGEYERAGLAGLYMSLTAADIWDSALLESPAKRQAKELKENVHWDFPKGDIAVKLDWHDTDKTADSFDRIIRWAWQVHDGVLFLPAVHRKQTHFDNYYLRLPTHNGLLSTFLQHGKSITKPKGTNIKAKKPEVKTEYYDEDRPFSLRYASINCGAELAYWKNCGKKILQNNEFTSSHTVDELASWIYPGSAPRFGKKEQQWKGFASICFLLAFAPLACHFIKLPNTKVKDKMKSNWAFIVPQVRSLSTFHKSVLRHSVTSANWPFQSEVAGLEDATLRYLTGVKLAKTDSTEVLAIVMGQVSHYSSQNVRKSHLRFSPAAAYEAVNKYRCFNRIFPATKTVRVQQNGKPSFISLPSCRERIAANLLKGYNWYRELAYIPFWHGDEIREKTPRDMSPEHFWFDKLIKYERRELMKLTKKDSGIWGETEDHKLVQGVFHRAFRRMLNEEEFAAKRGGGRSLRERWDDKVDEVRRKLNSAKTQPLCRATIVGLLAEANSRHRKLKTDGGEEHAGGLLFWQEDGSGNELSTMMWGMLNDRHDYAKARDLALLALITFTDGRLANKNKTKEAI